MSKYSLALPHPAKIQLLVASSLLLVSHREKSWGYGSQAYILKHHE